MPRNVTVVTGTRAEYGLLRSTMEAIKESPELSLSVVATGMHLSSRHGYTVTEIEEDGFTVDREVHMLLSGDTGLSMAKSLGIGISGVAEVFGDLDPNIVIVLGDRGEAFAGAVVAAHMNIPVAHVHGGDKTQGGTIDDSIRHALTKFAHIHFPVTDASRDRILELEEEPWRITTVGAPGLDDVLAGNFLDAERALEQVGLDHDSAPILVVQHPVTKDVEEAGEQMRTTCEAVATFDREIVIVYPNSDAGGEAMIDVIESFAKRDGIHGFANLPRRQYLGLLSAAAVLVGNSSSGLIEAPSFGLPVVDIGERQAGRERAEYVVHVDHDEASIRQAIERCLDEDDVRGRAASCENPYSRGGAADRIVERLESIKIDDRLLQKHDFRADSAVK